MGSQGQIFMNQDEINEGIPEQPKEPELGLIARQIARTELDPIIKQACEEFLADDAFVKTQAFL